MNWDAKTSKAIAWIGLLLLIICAWLISWQRRSAKTIDHQPPARNMPLVPVGSDPTGLMTQIPKQIAQPPARRYEGLSDPRWQWWREMESRDIKFEWKMEISFFGMVMDEKNQPVEGVEVLFGWTDLSPTGNSTHLTHTDQKGRFQLTDRTGKTLVIRSLKKGGYYTSRKNAQFGFEYAAFFNPAYHHPDPKKPVIFRLRKKGTPEPLLIGEQEQPAAPGQTTRFEIGGGATVTVELLTKGILGAKDWRARISVPGGGLQVTDEEFAFLAAASGYRPSLLLDHDTPKPPAWMELYEGGVFFIKTPTGFGRVELKMIPGKDWMRLTSYVNPSGSRNLEFDPERPIKSGGEGHTRHR